MERPWDFSGVEGREPAQQLKRLLERSDMKWQHVRESLAGFNLEYRAKGSGAVVIDRDKPDKLHPKPATWAASPRWNPEEGRLGSFEPSNPAGDPAPCRRATGNSQVYAQDGAAAATRPTDGKLSVSRCLRYYRE